MGHKTAVLQKQENNIWKANLNLIFQNEYVYIRTNTRIHFLGLYFQNQLLKEKERAVISFKGTELGALSC